MATPRTGRPVGRPKGSRSKTYSPHRHIEQLVAAGGLSPRDVMLAVMRWHYQEKRYDAAVAVAEKVAVYVHPRLSCGSVTVNPPSLAQQMMEITDDELRAHIRELEELAGVSHDTTEEEKEKLLVRVKPRGSA
jgi:RecJ-like exonuclease